MAAKRLPIDPQLRMAIDRDLSEPAIEGMSKEYWMRVRTRAAWMAGRFLKDRTQNKSLRCDQCSFDPATRVDVSVIRPRSLLDVHHKHPLEEGVRYTNISDFALLCPTCHRIEHAMLKAATSTARSRLSEPTLGLFASRLPTVAPRASKSPWVTASFSSRYRLSMVVPGERRHGLAQMGRYRFNRFGQLVGVTGFSMGCDRVV
jgi:5-methylcytosine-specific restriction endonuclease McrA